MKTALVAGSTGLIGSSLIELLVQSQRYREVKAITRRDLNTTDPKINPLFIDYRAIEKARAELQADDVFCCLGTTMAKANGKDKFRVVDYSFPLALAQTSHAAGAKQFLLVSSLGADKDAKIFYNRVKGETEQAISRIGFECVHIFRPSLLFGPREEARSAEDAAKLFYRVFGFIIPDKYKAIDASRVAGAMIHFASLEKKGTFIHESKEMQNLLF